MKKNVLELGSGINYYKGTTNENVTHLDIKSLKHIEIVHDLNRLPLPFKKESFDKVVANHVFEHLISYPDILNNIHMILKDRGEVSIVVPYFSSPAAFTDPTHIHFFTSKSFDYFDPKTKLGRELAFQFAEHKFDIINKELHFYGLSKVPFLMYIANKYMVFYETVLSRILPASELHVLLRKG